LSEVPCERSREFASQRCLVARSSGAVTETPACASGSDSTLAAQAEPHHLHNCARSSCHRHQARPGAAASRPGATCATGALVKHYWNQAAFTPRTHSCTVPSPELPGTSFLWLRMQRLEARALHLIKGQHSRHGGWQRMCSSGTARARSTATAYLMLASARRASLGHGGGDPAYARMPAARGLHVRAHHIQARVVVGDAVANEEDIQGGGSVQLAQGERQQQRGGHTRAGSHPGEQAALQEAFKPDSGVCCTHRAGKRLLWRIHLAKMQVRSNLSSPRAFQRFQPATWSSATFMLSFTPQRDNIRIACSILACLELLAAASDTA